jgi:hypothetical protein
MKLGDLIEKTSPIANYLNAQNAIIFVYTNRDKRHTTLYPGLENNIYCWSSLDPWSSLDLKVIL